MRVLVACETSGIVRGAFEERGHDAWSCDTLMPESWQHVVFASELPLCECCGEEAWCEIHQSHFGDCSCIGPTEDDVMYRERDSRLFGSRHFNCDVREVLDKDWDLMIAHPPCTYLCSSGMHWTVRGKRDPKLTETSLEFVRELLGSKIPLIALENPVGCISTRIRKPDQIIQPWQFGDPESKATCLWLKGLKPLVQTNVLPIPKSGRWNNQTASGQNKLTPGNGRWKQRARTYQGIATAMAYQWG